MFSFRRGDFPVTEHVADRTIALPFFSGLSVEQIEIVTQALVCALGRLRKPAVAVSISSPAMAGGEGA